MGKTSNPYLISWEDGWTGLASSIVIQACDDYLDLKLGLKPDKHDFDSLWNEDELMRFFNSEWFGTLCAISGSYIVSKLDEQIANMKLKYVVNRTGWSYTIHDINTGEMVYPKRFPRQTEAATIAAQMNDIGLRVYQKMLTKYNRERGRSARG